MMAISAFRALGEVRDEIQAKTPDQAWVHSMHRIAKTMDMALFYAPWADDFLTLDPAFGDPWTTLSQLAKATAATQDPNVLRAL